MSIESGANWESGCFRFKECLSELDGLLGPPLNETGDTRAFAEQGKKLYRLSHSELIPS